MGKPVDDYETGDACPNCFEPPDTPAELYVAFHGTAFDGTYTLPQFDQPCIWVEDFEGPDQMSVRTFAVTNKIDVLQNYFLVWTTTMAGCTQLHGVPPYDIYGYWWWGVHPILDHLLVKDNILNMPGTVYEAYARDVGDWDFRIANTNGRTNCLIKFRPQFYLDN